MIERDYCFIADTGALLWGFFCATVRQSGLAQIRGVSLINGWRVDTGIARLLNPLEYALRQDGIQHLMHLGLEGWLVPPLVRQRFVTQDYIINFELAVSIKSLLPEHKISAHVYDPWRQMKSALSQNWTMLLSIGHGISRAVNWCNY